MNSHTTPLLSLALAALTLLLGGCATKEKSQLEEPSLGYGKQAAGTSISAPGPTDDDLDEYDVVVVSDPLEALNRATFLLNHGIYTVILRPVSKGYQFLFPQFLRNGIHNAYENVTFPGRMVNHSLQGEFGRSGKELGKFLVNSTVGVGGLWKPSQKIPALADVPSADTGQSFGKWGIGHGPYLVLPVFGPSSVRDTVGMAGDFALNPVNWVSFIFGGATWTLAVTTPNTVRSLPPRMDTYDATTKDALDRYLAARTAYMQYRENLLER